MPIFQVIIQTSLGLADILWLIRSLCGWFVYAKNKANQKKIILQIFAKFGESYR